MAEGDCTVCSTTILIVLNPNNQSTVLKCASVGLIRSTVHNGTSGAD